MQLAAQLISALVLNAVVLAPLWAQAPVDRLIFTCVDASGVRLTSDRLIPQCIDREQRVLGPSGVVRQRISPSMTEAEVAEDREARQLQQREKDRAKAQMRHDQSLLARYPDRATYEAYRQDRLQQVQALRGLSHQRFLELKQQEHELLQELEFYAKDVSTAAAQLKKRLQNVQLDVRAQQAQITARENDVRRLEERFEADLQRLQVLWMHVGAEKKRSAH